MPNACLRDPLLALVMLVLMFWTAGVPPFVGFWAKLRIIQELWATDHPWHCQILSAIVVEVSNGDCARILLRGRGCTGGPRRERRQVGSCVEGSSSATDPRDAR